MKPNQTTAESNALRKDSEARAHRLGLRPSSVLRLKKSGGGTKCCKVQITKESCCRQKAMDPGSRPGSSAVNRLKGRENEIQVPVEKEEEEHVLPLSLHTDKPRAPHFSSRLNPILWLPQGLDWPPARSHH